MADNCGPLLEIGLSRQSDQLLVSIQIADRERLLQPELAEECASHLLRCAAAATADRLIGQWVARGTGLEIDRVKLLKSWRGYCEHLVGHEIEEDER